MKKNIIAITISAAIIMIIAGCSGKIKKTDVDEARLTAVAARQERPTLPEASGGLVLNIEQTTIKADEIIEPVKDELSEMAKKNDYDSYVKEAKNLLGKVLMQKITDAKLHQKAKAALPPNTDQEVIDNIVEQEVQKFIAKYGGNYANAEQMLKEMGLSWKEFYEQQKRAILVQSFVSGEIKDEKPITHSELIGFYEQIKDNLYTSKSFFEFSLIDIQPEKMAGANDPNRNCKAEAIEAAKKIVEKINAGSSFAEMAKEYSHDSSAANGGRCRPASPDSLAKPYDMIETACKNMVIGQVSEPLVADGHVFIVKLENRQVGGVKPFEQVQKDVEARYVLYRRQKTVNDMLEKIMTNVDLKYADTFLEYCLQRAYRQVTE